MSDDQGTSSQQVNGGVRFAQNVDLGEKGFVYDPDQNPEEKRQVRRRYRDLNKIGEGAINPNEFTADDLVNQVQRANQLFADVKGPQEATLDSAFLLMASNVGAAKARAMKSGPAAFDVDDFVSKLVAFMGGRAPLQEDAREGSDFGGADVDDDTPLDWEKIGRKALAKSRRVPVIDFMLGPLSIEQKKRVHVQRSKLVKDDKDRTKPQEIREQDIERAENETTKNVLQLRQLLEQYDYKMAPVDENDETIGPSEGGVNLFKFIVNPTDFGQSVENLFYLSFLIRDGNCAMEIRDGEPILYACEPADQGAYDAGAKKQQVVMELDMATWKRAIEEFNITEPAVPTRAVQGMRINGRWYG